MLPLASPWRSGRPTRMAERSQLWLWSVRGFGLGIGLFAVVILALVAQAAVDVIVLVAFAVLLASALDPVVNVARNRLGLSRVKAIASIYVLLIIVATLLVVLLVPAAVTEMNMFSKRLPELITEARNWSEQLQPAVVGTTIGRLINTFDSSLMRSGVTSSDPDTIVEFGLTAADAALAVLSVLTMIFFWLISRETIQRFALAMIPLPQRGDVRAAWNEVEHRVGYWFRGQLAMMTLIGVANTIAYLVLGLPNALLLGVFAGLTEIIPIVGPAIGAIPAVISALVLGGPELALVVVGVYVVIQMVEGNVLVPIVMKNAVGLPPFVVIVSLLVGSAVAGIIGALLAIPVAAAGAAILENAQARKNAVAMDTIDMTGDDEDGEADDDGSARLARTPEHS